MERRLGRHFCCCSAKVLLKKKGEHFTVKRGTNSSLSVRAITNPKTILKERSGPKYTTRTRIFSSILMACILLLNSPLTISDSAGAQQQIEQAESTIIQILDGTEGTETKRGLNVTALNEILLINETYIDETPFENYDDEIFTANATLTTNTLNELVVKDIMRDVQGIVQDVIQVVHDTETVSTPAIKVSSNTTTAYSRINDSTTVNASEAIIDFINSTTVAARSNLDGNGTEKIENEKITDKEIDTTSLQLNGTAVDELAPVVEMMDGNRVSADVQLLSPTSHQDNETDFLATETIREELTTTKTSTKNAVKANMKTKPIKSSTLGVDFNTIEAGERTRTTTTGTIETIETGTEKGIIGKESIKPTTMLTTSTAAAITTSNSGPTTTTILTTNKTVTTTTIQASIISTTTELLVTEPSTVASASLNNQFTLPTTIVPNKSELLTKDQMDLSLEINSMHELREYKRELNQILRRIEKELFLREGFKTKQFTPVMTTLPRKLSSMFLQKIGAALNVTPKESDQNELNKRFLALVASRGAPSSGAAVGGESSNAAAESFVLAAAATAASANNNRRFNPTKNHSLEECKRLSQADLVRELKQRGTYNPELMAWDVSGVLSFLGRTIADQYERQTKSQKSSQQAIQRNVETLERLLAELNLHCNVSTPEVIAKLSSLTLAEPRRSIMSPSIRLTDDEIRYKRNVAEDLFQSFNRSRRRDILGETKKQKLLGEVHVVPFGCDKRGEIEDGYLRLCGACQAIRKLPDSFFPPFINEVTCDEDKACLYFYDYPHGKCKQKHMNFVVLKNIGTNECQVWQKFNLNVRVSCECFVDEMSFFAKYV